MHRQWIGWCFGLLLFALGSPERRSAAADSTLRDSELFARWLDRSPEVTAWRARIGAARFDAVTAGLAPNPGFSFTLTQLVTGENVNGKTNYGFQLEIPLPIFGQLAYKRSAALLLVSAAEIDVEVLLWERAADIHDAMRARAFASAKVDMLDRNLGELARVDRIVRARAAAGANSQYDVLRVEATAATMRAGIANAKIERDRAEAALLALIGDATLSSAPVERAGLAGFAGPDDEQQLMELALARRPDLARARRNAAAQDAAASALRRAAVPMPSLFVATSITQGPFSFDLMGGLSIALPVFDRNQGPVGRAESEASSQRSLGSALETRIRAEVIGTYRARKAAKLALDDFRAHGVSTVAELLSRAETTYQAGAFSIAELFDAYRAVWEARVQELDLERQMADAEVDLERACVLVPLRRAGEQHPY
jgi:outer membrane protein, heavy metal efflux system